jgi:hypothetical protein
MAGYPNNFPLDEKEKTQTMEWKIKEEYNNKPKFRSPEEINRLEALKCVISRGFDLDTESVMRLAKEYYNYITTGDFNDEE